MTAVKAGRSLLLSLGCLGLLVSAARPLAAQPAEMGLRTFTVPVHAATEYCRGGQTVNTTANGYSGHKNMIAQRYAILAGTPPNAVLIGWGYVSYGGRSYFQLVNVTRLAGSTLVNGASPVIRYPGTAYGAYERSLNALGLLPTAMPPPYSTIASNSRFLAITCHP